jgi:ABC-type sugar transport system ATPase subunit
MGPAFMRAQQMLAIGRALMSAPRLTKMSEPAIALSPQMIEPSIDTIERLRRRGLTLLLIEGKCRRSNEDVGQRYALRLGEIVEEDPDERFEADRLRTVYLDIPLVNEGEPSAMKYYGRPNLACGACRPSRRVSHVSPARWLVRRRVGVLGRSAIAQNCS